MLLHFTSFRPPLFQKQNDRASAFRKNEHIYENRMILFAAYKSKMRKTRINESKGTLPV